MQCGFTIARWRLTLVLLVSISWACSPTPAVTTQDTEGTSVDEAAVLAEIEELRSGFLEFVSTGDMSVGGPLMADGAMMVPPAGNGWSDMLAAAEGAPFPAGSSIRMSPRETVVIDGEWAYEFGSSVFTWTPEGGEPEQLRDTYLILFRNQGDGWKIWREVASANLPPDAM
jgi:ketosteroid isomerase-like protein